MFLDDDMFLDGSSTWAQVINHMQRVFAQDFGPEVGAWGGYFQTEDPARRLCVFRTILLTHSLHHVQILPWALYPFT